MRFDKVDRLFVGTSTGSLQIYELTEDDNGVEQAELVTTKNLGRKAIDQISYSKDINSPIVLSGMDSPPRFFRLVLSLRTYRLLGDNLSTA